MHASMVLPGILGFACMRVGHVQSSTRANEQLMPNDDAIVLPVYSFPSAPCACSQHAYRNSRQMLKMGQKHVKNLILTCSKLANWPLHSPLCDMISRQYTTKRERFEADRPIRQVRDRMPFSRTDAATWRTDLEHARQALII